MGPQPAEHTRRHELAISADRIFDGYRWHNDAVILIDRGLVQGIVPRSQSAGDWPTEVMPPWTMLAPGLIDPQVHGGGGILVNDEPTPDAMRDCSRTSPVRHHKLLTYFDKRCPREGDRRNCCRKITGRYQRIPRPSSRRYLY
jgi:imidazolonepropionase-like amidohydrolase